MEYSPYRQTETSTTATIQSPWILIPYPHHGYSFQHFLRCLLRLFR